MRHVILIICVVFIWACSESTNKTNTLESPDKAGKITIEEGSASLSDNVSPFIGYGITGENMVRYAPDGEETAVTKEIGAHVVIRNSPYASIHKSLLMKRLSKEFIVKCSACHDDYGNGVIGPSLLTKNADEIFDMIAKYKTHKADNVLMQTLVSKMNDDEIRFIANDIARFNEEIRKENSK